VNAIQKQLMQGFASASKVEISKPEISGAIESYVETGRGKLPGPVHLLNWDANSIHGFVFGTTNAAGIRGASTILKEIDKDLNSGAALGLQREQVLFAGGGSGMAVVAADKVEAVTDALHRIFARRTLIATCSAASVVLDHHPFAERVVEVSRRLAKWRLEFGPDAEPMVPFFAERCEVCGRRAAACEKRRLAGPRKECGPCGQAIDRGNPKDADEVQDFQEIADEKQGGYYAVLYADGNGVGKIIADLRSPLQFATFSRELNALLEAAFEAVKERYGLKEEQRTVTATRAHQLPICAGDDLVAILPGEIAVQAARDLLEEFEQRVRASAALRQLKVAGLALSAGVAIGPVRLPVRHLLSEAEALLKKAKQRHYRRDEPGSGVSAVDFAVVRDGSPRAASTPSQRWAQGNDQEPLTSGRPYTLTELQHFSARHGAVRSAKIGKSQLYAVNRYAAAGPAQLRNHMLYQVGRDENWRQLLEQMEDAEMVTKMAAEKAEHKGSRQAPRQTQEASSECMTAQRTMAQVLPTYGERRVFDFGDMLELHRLWVEEEVP